MNHRLGNTVLATAGVAALCDALPHAEIDFVGGAFASSLMRGHPLRAIHGLPRAPLRLLIEGIRLVRRLRRSRYDVAIHLGTATGSLGAWLVALSGATHRIGVRRRDGNVFFTSAVPAPKAAHKVEAMREYLAALGILSACERSVRPGAAELEWTACWAQDTGVALAQAAAMFIGARERKGKAWPLASFAGIADGLRARGLRPVLFVGPDERGLESELRPALEPAVVVHEPDIRRVAALIARCRIAVTPDAGPMHLAIAVGTPTVALFRKPGAEKWGPLPTSGAVVFDREGRDVCAVLRAVDALLARGPSLRSALRPRLLPPGRTSLLAAHPSELRPQIGEPLCRLLDGGVLELTHPESGASRNTALRCQYRRAPETGELQRRVLPPSSVGDVWRDRPGRVPWMRHEEDDALPPIVGSYFEAWERRTRFRS